MTSRHYTTLGYGLWKTLTINTVIAIGITLFGDHSLWNNLVYSHCIGLSIGAAIDAGRILLSTTGAANCAAWWALFP